MSTVWLAEVEGELGFCLLQQGTEDPGKELLSSALERVSRQIGGQSRLAQRFRRHLSRV